MENKKLLINKSNFDSRTNSAISYKYPLSPSKSNYIPFNLKRNHNKLFSPKNKERVILMKTSNSILLNKRFLITNEEKTVYETEKCFTENLEGNHKDGNNKLYFVDSKKEESSEEIKQKVCKIFNNFAKFSKEENMFVLAHQALIKILRFINILDDKNLKLSDIDLILKKVSPKASKLNQEHFLDFVAQLAYKLDANLFNMNPKNAILKIVKDHFDPFIECLDKPNQEADENEFLSSTHMKISIPSFIEKFDVQPEMIILITSIYNGLREVYQNYFIYEVNDFGSIDQIKKESLSDFIEFCRDYEITPYLLNVNQLACYWNFVNSDVKYGTSVFDQKRDLGKMFTLSKFGLMIIHFGIMTFSKFNQGSIEYPDIDKLVYFLEKLESSKGFQNFERKTNRPHKSSVTFLPPKDLIKQVSMKNELTKSNFSNNEKIENKEEQRLLKDFNLKKRNRLDNNLRSILSLSNDVIEMIEDKLDLFKEIFLSYAKIGDKLNFNKLSYSAYLKFLKDCNLIHQNTNTNSNDLQSSLNSRTFSPTRKILPSCSSNSLKNSQKIASSYMINGRLIESEAFCIFCTLTGHQNFDNTSKIKNHFNLNKGYAPKIGEITNDVKMARSKLLTTSKSNVPLKMDFNLFIKSFELLGKKIFPGKSLDESVITFIEKNFKDVLVQKEEELSCGKRLIIEILHKIRKDDVIELLRDIHQVIMLHFENYCNNLGYMDFDQFYNFYKDFGLFPEFVNLVELRNIFFALSDILYSHYKEKDGNSIKEENNSQMENNKTVPKDVEKKVKDILSQNEYINFDLFLDSLAIASTFCRFFDEFVVIDRILYLVEKMSQSKGISASQKRNGNTFSRTKDFSYYLGFLKEKYPDFYRKKQLMQTGNKVGPIKFNKIFEK